MKIIGVVRAWFGYMVTLSMVNVVGAALGIWLTFLTTPKSQEASTSMARVVWIGGLLPSVVLCTVILCVWAALRVASAAPAAKELSIARWLALPIVLIVLVNVSAPWFALYL